MAHANPGYHHVQVGDVLATALNDGQFDAALEYVVNLPAADGEALLAGSFRPLPPRITVGCFLLRFGGRHVLVDAGTGNAMGHVLGHARHNLAAAGVRPEAIDTVLVTHLHPDHVGGLVDAEGKAVYPKAELVIHEAETAFWLDKETAARAPEGARSYFTLAQQAVGAYGQRVRTVADGAEVLPGITAQHFPGHTPGHSGWRISSGRETLLIWGDIVHLPGIQFARPEAGMAFDTDATQARETRARVFEMTAAERMLVAGMHLDFPTFGHVVRHGGSFAFEPLVWTPTAAGLFPAPG
jgi:glyoxylase-like metal-dependent hydrolase (beta-lactamase superfamily II)